MKILLLLGIIFVFGVAAKISTGRDPDYLPLEEETDYISKWIQVSDTIGRYPELRSAWKARTEDVSANDYIFGPPTFECSINPPSKKAETVHELTPYDVNVVSAMGDSITHGMGVGAENFAQVFNGNRGESWSIGGDKTLDDGVITLSNVLRKFNPDLKGYSTCYSSRLTRRGWLNVAWGGATSKGMPEQAQDIIDVCEADPAIDNENDWKVITLLIGGNDLCASCLTTDYNATNYAARLEEAMDILHAQLPRALVNIVPMFDITPLRNFSQGLICEFVQPAFCRCGILDPWRDDVRATQLAYYEEVKKFVDTGKYDTRNDFTVAIQPMFVNLIPPIDPDTGFYDKSFLSYDCFHPSRKAHQAFAYALWNTMLIPYDDKPLEWDPYEENPTFYCPTEENPYFGTRLNGK